MTAVVAAGAVLCSCGQPSPPPSTTGPATTPHAAPSTAAPPPLPPVAPDPAFAPIAPLIDAAIAAHRLPGAVVQVGHGGTIVYRQAFGERKLPGEPGLDNRPSPAEPMTPDTLFDMASLTKCLATAVAVLQLVEAGRVAVDEPVQTYLPGFNTEHDPRRAAVTVRMLLTHTSGIGGDLSHQGPWGLAHPDKADGVRRALTAPLEFGPGERFHYSDIGFIVLGALVEKLTGEPLDHYVPDHVFAPLHMSDTRYLPVAKACGPHRVRGSVIAPDPDGDTDTRDCPEDSWSTALLSRIAPTAHDGDTEGINPDFGALLRGTVHDPTARRMGGVAGSAGVFSTVHDVGLFAQALLDRLGGRPSAFPLSTATLTAMTSPQQPGHSPQQLVAANDATRAATAATPDRPDPLLAPAYPAIGGQDLRGFGWDIDTPHSAPRGVVFPIGSVGHTGFTGVTLWIDPGSDTYVVVLANVIHQPGGPPIAGLSGEIATLAARALHLYGS
ncbi:beta-lactamase family protein [Mycobacterium koreense]|uniref:Serine hydrolase n=1 Tax=Mycolicibacillus koreensis TaxID=1069220 RepID=A0AA91PBC5_9MYCO|nr:serine hydrolase domain-containing protein [Mycolicibacillus koreensis]MCV7250453.1 beta-lactamase family protein [Mycolicibacillus koreensis]OSC27783.1 serine hydrolase [Mycolicibacillus koreensis]